MVKKKKNIVVISIIIIVFLILALILLTGLGTVQQTAFYDKELGIIEVGNSIGGLGLVEQVSFRPSFPKVGDKVRLDDISVLSCDRYKISSVIATVYADGGLIQAINVPAGDCSDTSYVVWVEFTPIKAGDYKGCFRYEGTRDGTSLNWENCAEITVTKELQPCEDICSWTHDKFITGGKIQAYSCIDRENPPYCGEVGVYVEEYRTVCNSGYVVSGTTSNIGLGKNSCVRIEEPISSECDGDLTELCPDGSTIIVQECINGKLVSTGEVCVEMEEVPPEVEEPVIEPGLIGEGIEDISTIVRRDYSRYYVVGGILLVLIIIIVILIVRRKR